jgi:hypothetical protein
MIAAGSAPSSDPPILMSPHGSTFPLLSTPLTVAFLDIAPLSRGHVLICPREHRLKATDLTGGEAAAIGFLLPVLSRCIMQALGGMTESASWNVIQANGKTCVLRGTFPNEEERERLCAAEDTS